jgi:hypothetical protein
VAVWNVGSRTRSFAFGIIALATLFVALWVGLGNGLHKNYETPTPVRIFRFSHCFVLLLTFSFLDSIGVGLVVGTKVNA